MKRHGLLLSIACLSMAPACAAHRKIPCTQGGESARSQSIALEAPAGKKQCTQVKNEFGKYVNDGKYYEWHTNDKIAVIGEYKLGKKTGRWIEYDSKGDKVSDAYYDFGREVPRP